VDAPLGDGGYQEGTPLVHDGILFFPNPGDVTQALNAATGDFIWEHRRKMPEDVGPVFPGRGNQPQSRDLRQLDPRQQARTAMPTR
jgi:glucose dehydrogenase